MRLDRDEQIRLELISSMRALDHAIAAADSAERQAATDRVISVTRKGIARLMECAPPDVEQRLSEYAAARVRGEVEIVPIYEPRREVPNRPGLRCVPHAECPDCGGSGNIMRDAGPGAGAYDMVGDCPRDHDQHGVWLPEALKAP